MSISASVLSLPQKEQLKLCLPFRMLNNRLPKFEKKLRIYKLAVEVVFVYTWHPQICLLLLKIRQKTKQALICKSVIL
jgi:hypothetical protein